MRVEGINRKVFAQVPPSVSQKQKPTNDFLVGITIGIMIGFDQLIGNSLIASNLSATNVSEPGCGAEIPSRLHRTGTQRCPN